MDFRIFTIKISGHSAHNIVLFKMYIKILRNVSQAIFSSEIALLLNLMYLRIISNTITLFWISSK